MSKNLVYGGPALILGSHGAVATGDVLSVTDAEATVALADGNFFEVPTRGRLEKKVTGAANLVHADSGKKIVATITNDATLTFESSPTLGDYFEVYFGAGSTSGKVISFDFSGKTYKDGAFILTGATIQTAGTGYTANDLLTVVGGTRSVAAVIKVDTVSGGVITGVSVQTAGSYTALPTNPVSVTGGTGTGAKFTLAFGQPALTLDQTADSTGLYYNGSQWVRY